MRTDLLRFLLHAAIIKFSSDPQPLVRCQASAAAATLLKRAWGELSPDQRRALITEVDSLATQRATVDSKKASMEVFTAIVIEFCPSTSSPMGLPWRYHEECKLQLQEEFLPDFLQHAVSVASQGATAALTGNDGGTCVASLNLLSALLAWSYTPPPFTSTNKNTSSLSTVSEIQQRSVELSLHIRPPPAWRQILLLEEQGLGWLGPLATGVRAQLSAQNSRSSEINSLASIRTLAQAVRQVLVQLSSMSGDIFIKESVDHIDHRHQLLGSSSPNGIAPRQPGPGTRGRHLAFIFRIILPEITPPSHAAFRLSSSSLHSNNNEEAVLDTCRALLAASTAHRLSGFLEASAGIEGGAPALFSILSELTVAMMGAGVSGEEGAKGEGTEAAEEAGDILIEMWSELCVDPCRGAIAGNQHVIAPAAAVFSATMRRELLRAASVAWEDEEDYEGGEEAHSESWLAGLAAIGRAACPVVLPALAHQLQECQTNLEACMQRNEDPSAALEQLCWVLGMCSIVLADAGDGEIPLIPIAIAEACVAAATARHEDPGVALAQRLLALGAVCHQHAGQTVISPRLMEEMCGALGRWAETYVVPDAAENSFLMIKNTSTGGDYNETVVPAIFSVFSDVQKATEVSEGLVRLAMSSLTQYPGDTTLHRAACIKLLAPLVRRRASCAVIVHCPAWQELCAASASRAQGIQQLEAGVQRRLMQCLIHAAIGFGDSTVAGREYVSSLLHPLSHTIQELSKLPIQTLQQADKALLSLSLIQSLRGAARGVGHGATHEVVYAHLESVQPALVQLLTAYQSQPSVYGHILKLAADIVEYHASMLEPSTARGLFHWAVQLVATYASHRTLSTSSASLQLEEERSALCALLRLLTQLTNTEASDESEVAAAVFEGLDRIMPSIQSEHLKFPKLRRAFFSLIAHMVEAHSSKVGELPAPTFSALMKALCFGIGVQDDTDTEAAVFEAAGALAKHHVMSIRHGGAGLGQLNSLSTSTNTTDTALGEVLHALLERVLINDPGFEAVDYSSEAALPLWLAEPAAAEGMLSLVAGRLGGDTGAVANVATAFQELGKAAVAAAGMDRASRRQFTSSFRRFVIEVRGILRGR
jgi:hypothetical protein